jgi:hypothetical protein
MSLRKPASFDNLTLQQSIPEGELWVFHWTLTGTHQGEFNGIPATGKRVNVSGMSIWKIVDGKNVEEGARIHARPIGKLRHCLWLAGPHAGFRNKATLVIWVAFWLRELFGDYTN